MISPNRECSSFPIKIKIDKADVGLENVDNTSDLDKPMSNAVREYIEANIPTIRAVTVDTTQNITGAKTFAGETTITGPLGVSGDTALTGKVTVEKELNVDSNGTAEINGKLTASNTANIIKAANHDSVLTSNDVLTAKDINEVNGSANNLLHRNGDESFSGILKALPVGYFRKESNLGSTGSEELFGVTDDANNLLSVLTRNVNATETIDSYSVIRDGAKGSLWIVIYPDYVALFLQFIAVDGTVSLKEIARCPE